MKPRSISMARARELALLVKATPTNRGKGTRRKNGRASTGAAVSPTLFERYLGHFGVGASVTGTASKKKPTRAAKRPTHKKKAARTKR